MNVERRNIARVVERNLADGEKLCVEAVEFHAECGCVVIIGFRVEDHENTCGMDSCDYHKINQREILTRFTASDAPLIPSEIWLGQCLDEAYAHDTFSA